MIPERLLSRWGDPKQIVTVSWSQLVIKSEAKGEKLLLNAAPGSVGPGFTALMGPSGAGKSTLMNALACRIHNVTIEGERLMNGCDYDIWTLKTLAGYVMQFEVLSETLTCEESLMYSAKLRLPKDWTQDQRQTRVDEVLQDMGLSHIKDVLVGGANIKGLSGGQRKRLSIGLELLTNPRVLYLDEPTTGLDSETALSICSLMQHLAQSENMTIMATLHQPSEQIFSMFTGMLLLKKGQTVYHGTPNGALEYFKSLGEPIPELTNPADYLIDVVTDIPLERFLENRPDSMKAAISDEESKTPTKRKKMELGESERISWLRELSILTHRSFKEMRNDWRNVMFSYFVSAYLGLMLGGYIYDPDGTNSTYFRSLRQVPLYACFMQGYAAAQYLIAAFPLQRKLYLKERASGMYMCSTFFLARVVADFLKQIPNAICFTVPVYFMGGWRRDAGTFFATLGILILCQTAAMALSLCISAICKTVQLSVVMLPFFLEVCRIFNGYTVVPDDQSGFWVVIDHISYVYYSYCGIIQLQMTDLVITCTPEQKLQGCKARDGNVFLEESGYDWSVGALAGGLCVYITVLYTGAYIGVRLLKH